MKFFTTSKLSENIHETPEGYLVCTGVPVARTGEMIYAAEETPLEAGSDGTVVINRDADEVFRPETMSSFEGKPVTILHPTDFVSPTNWGALAKGVMQNVRRGEGDQSNDLIADLLITDSMAINLVKSGLREVSCGYEATYEQTEKGRGVQIDIIGNHLALVDKGRAGSSYAINDHKRKGSLMKVKEKIASIFGRAADEAMKVAEDAAAKEDDKDDKAKDGDMPAYSMDDVMKAVKDLGSKVEGFMKPKDAQGQPDPVSGAPAEPKDEDVAPSLEDRLKKCELVLEKLMEGQSTASDEDGDDKDKKDKAADDDDSDEASDEDVDVSDEDCDDDAPAMVGDTASRVEILAPGLTVKGKGIKEKALRSAYATKDGKGVMDQILAGKAPNFKDAKQIDMLFVAASELLKQARQARLAGTKTRDFKAADSSSGEKMTAEKLNAKAEAVWAARR